jgi:uroporphyrinogen-III synthase
VYQRRKPDVDAKELIEKLTSLKIHAVTITSGEALHNLLAMLDKQSVILLRALPLVVVSERIKQMAEQLGFKWIEVSKPADSAILETLKMLFNGENSGRSNRTTTRNSSFQLGS